MNKHKRFSLLWPHGVRKLSSFTVFVFLWVTPSTKSTNFCSRYLVQALSERDEIWHITTHIGKLWLKGTQLGRQNSEGVKIATNRLAEGDKIWHDDGHSRS